MKNIIKITIALFLIGLVSCNYLDVVPQDSPTLEHAYVYFMEKKLNRWIED